MEGNRGSRLLPATERIAALSRVSAALMDELNEERLLHLIAETACELTGAMFAAFTLRPMSGEGQPLVPSEGHLFYLAAVVGATPKQEALFRQMPLGGEGLLAPIFRHGVSVLVSDALAFLHKPDSSQNTTSTAARTAARQAAFAYVNGRLPKEDLRSMGIPRGHPVVRSFLGAPLLDHSRQVRGGLLLGHTEPDQFTQEDEVVLVGLATQAAIALENAHLYRAAQMRAQEVDRIFESIVDGVTLIDDFGNILRENSTARLLREVLTESPGGERAIEELLFAPAQRTLNDEAVQDITVIINVDENETREYLVNASPLRLPPALSGPLVDTEDPPGNVSQAGSRAVVVWHDITEARRLLNERREHAETEARRALLQLILDELPTSVYLVRGHDARLVLANRAATRMWGAVWQIGQPMHEFLTENGLRVFGANGRPLVTEQLATRLVVQDDMLVTIRQHQETIRHPDGTTLPLLVNAVKLTIPNLDRLSAQTATQQRAKWEPVAVVVHQDVTALKEAEQLKDEFLSVAAHELRNPLLVLKGYAQMLLLQSARGKGSALAEWQAEALREIDLATQRLDELTEDLFDVTRLQAGQLVLHDEPTDLVALTRRVVKRQQMTTDRHEISLSTILSHIVLSLDAGRMEQVLSNLIGNAIKYSPRGGPINVSIHKEDDPEIAVLSIRDHGIGIPEDQQARIFSRFARADNALASGVGGTGLGLYLSRELVERQGGHLWFGSTEGQGSTFFIMLPVGGEYASYGNDAPSSL